MAATAGPGLIGGVMVGLTTAKALALASGKPLIAVNHLEAHALSARLTEGVAFPFLLLLISGGHCQLLGVEGVGRFHLYGTTIDDAVGEAFDKTAKLLGLGYPGGPNLEFAARGRRCQALSPAAADARARRRRLFLFGPEDGGAPVHAKRRCARGRSGGVIPSRGDRCPARPGQSRDGDVSPRVSDAQTPGFVVAGGVASNGAIREALGGLSTREGFAIKIPPPRLCTDNAAMVAWAGVERGQLGLFDGLGAAPKARWPLDARVGGTAHPTAVTGFRRARTGPRPSRNRQAEHRGGESADHIGVKPSVLLRNDVDIRHNASPLFARA